MTFSIFKSLLCVWALLVSLSQGLSIPWLETPYALCQYPTPISPLIGCPLNTILVGPNQKFTKIQSAIESIQSNHKPYHILVLAGNYTEQLNVTRQAPLYLLGQTKDARNQSANLVNVLWSQAQFNGSGFNDNTYTSVLTVAPNLNASLTGSGPTGFNVPEGTPFGNIDFRVYNIDFRNIYSLQSAGPAHALGISRANGGFYYSGFYSYQDTLYTGKLGNSYFYGCELAGQTDFIYGFGTAWVEKSKLTLRGCGGGIIAWKGTNTTFTNKYGAYISNSEIQAQNETVSTKWFHKCSLGRPWNPQHRSIYINTEMDSSVLPQGYTKWSTNPATDNFRNYTFMAEYGSYGPGWNETARINGNVTIVLDKPEVEPYKSPLRVFMTPEGHQPHIGWIDPLFLAH